MGAGVGVERQHALARLLRALDAPLEESSPTAARRLVVAAPLPHMRAWLAGLTLTRLEEALFSER